MWTVVRGMSADSLPLRDAARSVCACMLAQVCSEVTTYNDIWEAKSLYIGI